MTTRNIFLAASAVFAFACTNGAVTDEVERGPLGKADNIGSCDVDACGGPAATGTCWCDDQCEAFGDCCTDKADVCDAEPPTNVCGGFAGFVCGDGEYCHYELGDTCGFADATGECRTTPDVCIELFAPVCGCDGNTYSNSCFAASAGASVLHDGACEQPEPSACGGFAGFVCDDGEYCRYDQDQSCGFADQMGRCETTPDFCIELFAPVCGCDGNTYGNSCFAANAGTSVVHDGPCN
jgi:hypothetical protein